MSRFYSGFILVLLVIGNHNASAKSKIKYGIDNAIEDLSFIPGAKFVLTSAVKIWLLYGEINELVKPNTTRIEDKLGELEAKLDQIDLHLDAISEKLDVVAEDVKDVKNIIQDKVIMELPKEINLDAKRREFANLISKVMTLYSQFKDNTNPDNHFNNETYLNFANAVTNSQINQLTSVLEQIKLLVIENSGNFNILNLLANKHLSNTLVCYSEESPLHQINLIYNQVMHLEVKGLAMTQFAYEVKQKLSKESISYESELNMAKINSYKRMSEIVKKVQNAMLIAHQDYWTCNLPILIEGNTFAKVGPVFQQYLIKEKDVDDGKERDSDFLFKGCTGSCQSRTNGTDKCETKYCKYHQKPCKGRVIDCQSFQPSLNICHAEKDSDRRYEFVEAMNGDDAGKLFGQKKTCPNENMKYLKQTQKVPISNKNLICEYCLCTCLEDNNDMSINRFISLKDIVSDVRENKIITGVKLASKNKLFHIEIQQGVLVKNGQIDQSTVSLKSADDFAVSDSVEGVDYHKITWEERTVNLDDLKTNDNAVLTGLRFKKTIDGVKLEIQVTPFDFESGKLFVEQSNWISNSDETPRSELDLSNRALPSSLKYQYLDSVDKQFLRFTTSSVKNDAGQTVVPLIDLQLVKTAVAVPLAGAGLIHKSNNADSAGFLSFKLFTYNYARHLIVEE